MLLGEAPPRVRVAPQATRANSWEDVADISASFGVNLDPWQELVLQDAMGERSDRTWSAKRVGLSVPRQNGKSQLLVSRALAGALLFGERKIVISAHLQDTARESFSKLMEIIEADGNTALRARIPKNGIMQAINREAVRFTSGATIQFKARSAAGGRGFSSDCLMLDEAQRLARRAWVSINSTMSAMPNPQVWLLGTPPTPDDEGDVFTSIRDAALTGSSTGLAWAEWSADPKDPALAKAYATDARVWTEDIARLCWSGNPAWNARINVDVVQGEFESYSREEFMLDRLGIWRSDSSGGTSAVPAEQWAATGIEEAPVGRRGYAVAFSLDGSTVALAGVRVHAGGHHVELIDAMSGPVEQGVAVLADWLAERWRDSVGIVISGKAGGPALVQALKDRKVGTRKVTLATTQDYFAACSMTLDALAESAVAADGAPRLTHLAQPGQALLDESIAVCDRKVRGAAGAWGWVATTAEGDETPTEAFSLAYWLGRTSRKATTQGRAVFV